MTDGASAWATVAASARGTSHIARDIVNQDAYRQMVLDDGTLVVAVADGAGSARMSHVGSQIAAEVATATVASFLTESPDADWLKAINEAFVAARCAIVANAVEESADPKAGVDAFATTLLIAIANDEAFLAAQRGDGVIISRDRATGMVRTAVPPQNGDYANQTFFLTDEVGDRLLHVEVLPPVSSFAAMTDGLTDLAISARDNAPHTPFFEPLERFALEADDADAAAGQLLQFLESERVCARTGDDKTLVVAALRDANRE